MERLKILLFGLAQGVWVALRGLGRGVLGQERFDRWIDGTGLHGIKNRLWLSRRALPDGNVIVYRPHDQCILDEIYARGAYSGVTIEAGQTVVDLGAHIGTFSLMAARKVGPTGRVIACEPSPRSLELLRRNLDANALSWVRLRPVALADAEGTADFFTAADPGDNPVADSLLASRSRTGVPVRVRRLDDLLAEEGVSVVDHLKIDVEGAELRVLAGAAKTLAGTRHIVMEVHPPHVDPDEVRRRLEGAGFRCKLSDATGSLILDAVR